MSYLTRHLKKTGIASWYYTYRKNGKLKTMTLCPQIVKRTDAEKLKAKLDAKFKQKTQRVRVP